MLGLSISAIGIRPIEQCLELFDLFTPSLQLEYLELAIGSNCPLDFPYPNIPLILHDSCLYQQKSRQLLKLSQPETWPIYADFIQQNQNVVAVSIHAPRRWECSRSELERSLLDLQQILQVPVAIEVMPTHDYWCSSLDSLVDFPLLLDVSHILIWHQGNHPATEDTCRELLRSHQIVEIHLSHNQGIADTHDLIPGDIWFVGGAYRNDNRYIADWQSRYFVTYESLPISLVSGMTDKIKIVDRVN
jgi:hypothetical protein